MKTSAVRARQQDWEERDIRSRSVVEMVEESEVEEAEVPGELVELGRQAPREERLARGELEG